jgi:hypothetical protein
MNARKYLAAGLMAMALSGCLEVKQHPGWVNGAYAGKADNRAAATSYHGDRFAWSAALANRARMQNEYNRSNP